MILFKLSCYTHLYKEAVLFPRVKLLLAKFPSMDRMISVTNVYWFALFANVTI